MDEGFGGDYWPRRERLARTYPSWPDRATIERINTDTQTKIARAEATHLRAARAGDRIEQANVLGLRQIRRGPGRVLGWWIAIPKIEEEGETP